jgi:hypothetical protein
VSPDCAVYDWSDVVNRFSPVFVLSKVEQAVDVLANIHSQHLGKTFVETYSVLDWAKR